MKKYLLIASTFVFSLILSSCSDGEGSYNPKELNFTFEEGSYVMSPLGGTVKVLITNPHGSISATSEADWLEAGDPRVSGNYVVFEVPYTENIQSRTAVIDVTSGSYQTKIVVTQDGAYLSANPYEMNFPLKAQDGGAPAAQTLRVTTTLQGLAATAVDSWITVTPVLDQENKPTGDFSISIPASSTARTGKINVTALRNGQTQTVVITVFQGAAQ